MSRRCRYLSDKDYCKYWDEQLSDAETIRCEGPGGWSDDCYVEDSRGGIYDVNTGKFMTFYEFVEETASDPFRHLEQETYDFLDFTTDIAYAARFGGNLPHIRYTPKGNE